METKKRWLCGVMLALAIGIATIPAGAQVVVDNTLLRAHVKIQNLGKLTLAEVPVPRPPKLRDFVVNEPLAVVLGKALFWDMQTGGDGVTACASCHFHSGADMRTKNQIHPGPNNVFDFLVSSHRGPNYTVTPEDFPFPKTLDDKMSSQGVFLRAFEGVVVDPVDDCTSVDDPPFQVGNINVRRVEPRNTPTTINAVFNHRNFWDGRANDTFNGQNPAGIRDQDAKVAVWDAATNTVSFQRMVGTDGKPLLLNASLASQAVGPPLSAFEMSCGANPARSFPDLGKKLYLLRPLAKQLVHANDSMLARYRYVTGMGLNTTYGRLVMQAFDRKYWGFRGYVPGTQYTQMEYNFPLFFGLAIQMYESTLVSGDTRYDRWAAGDDNALTEQEKLGLMVFSGFPGVTNGQCITCHVGPEFTGASVRLRGCLAAGGMEEPIERMVMGNGQPALYDAGFYNVGVRRTNEDLGVGEDNLAFSRQVTTGAVQDFFCPQPGLFEVPGGIVPGERIAVDGAFKVPTLRNVELTAPYFHTGGHATLEQVVEFYDTGAGLNGCGLELGFHEENIANLDAAILCLGLAPEEDAGLVAFMKALTDERVRNERAPFDHPQLFIPNGHPVDEFTVTPSTVWPIEAVDQLVEIPAVGASGRTQPRSNFLELPQRF